MTHFYYNIVCTNNALVFTLLTMPLMAKDAKVVCLVNNSKSVRMLITGYEYLNNDGHTVPMDLTMTNIQ